MKPTKDQTIEYILRKAGLKVSSVDSINTRRIRVTTSSMTIIFNSKDVYNIIDKDGLLTINLYGDNNIHIPLK